MDTALSSQSRPAAVLSPSSFVITLLLVFIVFKGNRREGGSEVGYYCSPQTPFVKGPSFFLLHPTTQEETHNDTGRKMIFVVAGLAVTVTTKLHMREGAPASKLAPLLLGSFQGGGFP